MAPTDLTMEEAEVLGNARILVVDDSASQALGDRKAQTEAAVAAVQAEIALMRTLKAALDPQGILNPGRMI